MLYDCMHAYGCFPYRIAIATGNGMVFMVKELQNLFDQAYAYIAR